MYLTGFSLQCYSRVLVESAVSKICKTQKRFQKSFMSQISTPAYIFKRSFLDFDELASEARQWDLDLNQLGVGKFRGDLLQFGFDHAHVAEARFGRSLNQKGSPPSGFRTICVPATADVQFIWRGKRINGSQLIVFPNGSELSCVSHPDFHIYTCSFSEDLLAAVSATLHVDGIDDLCQKSEVFHCSPAVMESVRQSLRNLCEIARSNSSLLTSSYFFDGVTHDLPHRLLSAIATSTRSNATATSRKRELALIRAETFIEQFACDDISIRDICRTAQVSQRTLDYAFMERFGLTPKAFLTAYRLNAVRKQLRVADPAYVRVKEVAIQWGFWHMGQFAADYRKRFGELPSETLRKVSV